MSTKSTDHFPITRVTSAKDELFDRFFEFMCQFAEDVTEEKEWYVKGLVETYEKGTSSNPYILIVIKAPDQGILGYISGNYMPLKSRRRVADHLSFSGLGHMMVQKKYRRDKKRHFGTALLSAFEEANYSYARERGEKHLGMMAEVEDGAVNFFSAKGFLWPRFTYYAQPPLVYSDNGEKCFFEVPENLMLRLTSGQNEIKSDFLRDMVYSMYYYWIMEKQEKYMGLADQRANKKRANRVRGYLFGKVFRDFCSSLEKVSPGNIVPMVHLPTSVYPSAILAEDRQTGIAVRKLMEVDKRLPSPSVARFASVPAFNALLSKHLDTVFDDRVKPTAFVFTDSVGTQLAAGVIGPLEGKKTDGSNVMTLSFTTVETMKRILPAVKRTSYQVVKRMGHAILKTTVHGPIVKVLLGRDLHTSKPDGCIKKDVCP